MVGEAVEKHGMLYRLGQEFRATGGNSRGKKLPREWLKQFQKDGMRINSVRNGVDEEVDLSNIKLKGMPGRDILASNCLVRVFSCNVELLIKM